MKTVPAGNSFRIKKPGRPVRPADAVASENSRSAILQRLVDGVLLFGHLSPAARYIEIDIADIRIGDSRCGSITLLRPPSKSIGSLRSCLQNDANFAQFPFLAPVIEMGLLSVITGSDPWASVAERDGLRSRLIYTAELRNGHQR